MSHFPFSRALVPGLLSVLMLSGAWAADAPRMLTRDELRACLDAGDALQKRRGDFVESSAVLERDLKALQKERDEIAEEVPNAQGNTTRRERLESRQRRYNEQSRAVQARLDAQRTTQASLQKELDEHNGRCANVPVRNEDRDAVMQERASAGRK